MRKNDSLELKIIRVALPLLIYYGVLFLFQTIFGIYAMWKKFTGIEGSDTDGYILAYHLFDGTDEYIRSHSLIVGFAAFTVTFFVLLVMMKREFGDTIFTGYKQIGGREVLLVGFIGMFTASGLGRLVNLLPMDNILGSYAQVSEEFMSNSIVFQILTLCIAAPLAEEVIFRGIMYRRLLEYADKMTAVMISALIFGIYHGNLIQGVYALALGILLCFVYDSCDTLLAPVFLHIVCNVTALLMMYFPVSKYINNRIVLWVIIMALELCGMVFFSWKMYYLKNEKREGEENKNV